MKNDNRFNQNDVDYSNQKSDSFNSSSLTNEQDENNVGVTRDENEHAFSGFAHDLKDTIGNAKSYNMANAKGIGGSLNNLARGLDGATRGLNNLSQGLGNASHRLNNISNRVNNSKRNLENNSNPQSNFNNRNNSTAGSNARGNEPNNNNSSRNGMADKLGNASQKVGGFADKLGGINKKIQLANNLNNVRKDPGVAKDMVAEVAKDAVKKRVIATVMTSALGCLPFVLVLLLVIFVCVLAGAIGSHVENESGGSSGYYSSGMCSYNVKGETVSDVKVRLLKCDGGGPIPGEELYDFETYIEGVVYAEDGGGPFEALKTEAVAARSYALTRAKGVKAVKLEQEDGQWILSIRNCSNDQNFCNLDTGCTKMDIDRSIVSTYEKGKGWLPPLAEDSNQRMAIQKAVQETRGEVLLDKNGDILYTSYTYINHNYWNSLAKDGKDYFEILMADYGDEGASKIGTANCEENNSSIDNNIGNADIETLIKMSDSEAWYQLLGIKTSSNKPSVTSSETSKRMTSVKIPRRVWSGTGSDPKVDTKLIYQNITVNAALADLWLAFFTDIYNEAPDFVIQEGVGCYNHRPNTNNRSSLSAHAYGVACDINPSTAGNGNKDTSYTKAQWEKLPETRKKYQIVYRGSKVVEIAHKYTLINGSDWNGGAHDAMHFSFIVDWTRSQAQACQGKVYCN